MTAAFVLPMLAHPWAGADPARYIAEPKLDGQRAQVHVQGHRTAAVFSRTGHDSLGRAGMAWLRELRWSVGEMILDAELYSGSGINTESPAVASAKAAAADASLSLACFDVLSVHGTSVMDEPWQDRRHTLEAVLGAIHDTPRVHPTIISDDVEALWRAWTGMGGEGVMLKARNGRYRPGKRSWDWQKLKVEETYDVVILGVSDKPSYTDRYRTGDVSLVYGFYDPAAEAVVTAGQGLMVGTRAAQEARIGQVAEVKCNGVMPSGALRHARLIRRPKRVAA